MAGLAVSGSGLVRIRRQPDQVPGDTRRAGPDPVVDTGDVYAISRDGSGQQPLFTPPARVEVTRVVPSRLTHNGERWFVGRRGEYTLGHPLGWCVGE